MLYVSLASALAVFAAVSSPTPEPPPTPLPPPPPAPACSSDCHAEMEDCLSNLTEDQCALAFNNLSGQFEGICQAGCQFVPSPPPSPPSPRPPAGSPPPPAGSCSMNSKKATKCQTKWSKKCVKKECCEEPMSPPPPPACANDEDDSYCSKQVKKDKCGKKKIQKKCAASCDAC